MIRSDDIYRDIVMCKKNALPINNYVNMVTKLHIHLELNC